MDWVTVALSLGDNLLELLSEKEKNKYKDKWFKAKKAYYDEKNKHRPNHAQLDLLEHDLFLLCTALGSAAPKPASMAQS